MRQRRQDNVDWFPLAKAVVLAKDWIWLPGYRNAIRRKLELGAIRIALK